MDEDDNRRVDSDDDVDDKVKNVPAERKDTSTPSKVPSRFTSREDMEYFKSNSGRTAHVLDVARMLDKVAAKPNGGSLQWANTKNARMGVIALREDSPPLSIDRFPQDACIIVELGVLEIKLNDNNFVTLVPEGQIAFIEAEDKFQFKHKGKGDVTLVTYVYFIPKSGPWTEHTKLKKKINGKVITLFNVKSVTDYMEEEPGSDDVVPATTHANIQVSVVRAVGTGEHYWRAGDKLGSGKYIWRYGETVLHTLSRQVKVEILGQHKSVTISPSQAAVVESREKYRVKQVGAPGIYLEIYPGGESDYE